MKWRVKVTDDDYGRTCVVKIRRWPLTTGIVVARLQLTAEDADMRLAEARAKAGSMARQITDLERGAA